MGEQRTWQGHVYTRNGPADDWTLQGPAPMAAPTVIPLPLSPQRQRENARQDAEDQRSRDAAARAEAAARRDDLKFNAGFNSDGSPKEPEAALDPATISYYAQQVLAGAPMPSIGMGKQAAATRQAIMTEVARQAGASGMTGADQVRQIAHYKAGSAAIKTLETQAATIGANEQTAMANGRQFLDRSAEMPGQTRFAPLNAISNWIQRKAGGTTVAAMDAAYNTFVNEYAKVVSGTPSGGGTLSDSARHEAMATLQSDASPEQKQRAYDQMKTDMDNRMAAIHVGLNSAYQNLTGKPGYDVPTDTAGLTAPPRRSDQPQGAAGVVPAGSGPAAPSAWDTTGQGGPGSLAPAGASEKRIDVPADMQQGYEAYVAQHRGHIDPADYAAFRSRQNQQYGFGAGDQQVFRDEALRLNDEVAKGIPLNLRLSAATSKLTGLDQFNAKAFNNPVGAFAMGAGSMAGGTDEVAGGLRSLIHGTSYDVERDKADAIRQSMADAYPVSTIAGNVAGTMADGLALSAVAPGAAAYAASRPIAASAAYGTINGALENDSDRVSGAAWGAGLGTVGGAIGSRLLAPVAERVGRTSVAQALAKGVNSTANRFRPNPVAMALAPKLSDAERSIIRMSPDMPSVRQNLSDAVDLGLPYSLADADPKLRMLGGTVSRKSPVARALAETTFDPRALGQADRAISAVDTHLAPVTNIAERSGQLLKAGEQAAGPSYAAAMSQPAPFDKEIDNILQTPAGREALARAHTIAANEGFDPITYGLDKDVTGNVVLTSSPTFKTLQLVKRGLDSHVEDFRNPISGKLDLSGDPLAQAIDSVRNRFNARLGALNPDYATGNAEWSQWAKRRDALNLGHDVLPGGTMPPRDVEAAIGGMDAQTLPEAQRGYATAMADQADRVRLSSNPYEAIYGSPAQQQKVAAVFPEGADQFARMYHLEKDMGKTRFETIGGSPTASRQAADDAIGDDLATVAIDAGTKFATGGGIPMATLLRRLTGDGMRLGMGKAGERRAQSVAQVLFDTTDPRAMLSVVDQLAEKQAAIAARSESYRKIVSALTAQTALYPNRGR